MTLLKHWRLAASALVGVMLTLLVQALWLPGASSQGSSRAVTPAEGGKEHEHEHGHDDAPALALSAAQLAASGVTLETAAPAPLAAVLQVPGQLLPNADREARVLAPVSGRVRDLRAQVGARVRAGAVLAVLESQALAEANAAYLAARERRALAETTFAREQDLWQKKISAEQDYLAAKRALAEARIEERSALQKLLALGVGADEARALQSDGALARYTLRAPVAGTVLERNLTLGEAVAPDRPLFHIADLSSLWIDLAVPVDSLNSVTRGQRVRVSAGTLSGEGRVIFVQPALTADSRSGSVRVALANPDGKWRPGMFVTAELVSGPGQKVLSVPASALQTLDGRSVVFVADADGLEPRPVSTGRRADGRVEVTAGLEAGDRYAATGSFVLKAELQKGEAEHEH